MAVAVYWFWCKGSACSRMCDVWWPSKPSLMKHPSAGMSCFATNTCSEEGAFVKSPWNYPLQSYQQRPPNMIIREKSHVLQCKRFGYMGYSPSAKRKDLWRSLPWSLARPGKVLLRAVHGKSRSIPEEVGGSRIEPSTSRTSIVSLEEKAMSQ